MPRVDLLALTPDDLASLTNRGTVKRAQRELESNEVVCEIAGSDDTDLTFTWSDGITCRFPNGKTIHDATCSSGGIGISRHIVRSVLAYQKFVAERNLASPMPATADESLPASSVDDIAQVAATAGLVGDSWDPGQITDDELIACFRSAAMAKARKRFEQGVLVELTRGAKPTARFLDDACTVRFMVPGDARYATADCAAAALPMWVALAVWSFRQLAADQLGGMLCLGHGELPTPAQTLRGVDQLVDETFRDGFSALGQAWSAKCARVEQSLREESLIWPAEIVGELLQQKEMYDAHDARFDPLEIVPLLGELTARVRSIASGNRAVPQLLVRGAKADRPTEISGGRFIGVGLGVRPGKRHATLSAYVQDADSGSLAVVERTFAEPDPQSGTPPRPFSQLAATSLYRGVAFSAVASSQVLIKSGKRAPSGLLVLPRMAGSLSIHPQTFQWEQLKPPFAAESFGQLTARFAALPPSFLRPRRRIENLHVVAVACAEEVQFDIAQQRLTAQLRDVHGAVALLVQPYHFRARDGFNGFYQALQQRGQEAKYVCGHVRTLGKTLEIRPVSIVFDDGQHRTGMNPWVLNGAAIEANPPDLTTEAVGDDPPLQQFLDELRECLSELLLTGTVRCGSAPLVDLAESGRRLGFVRLTEQIAKLADELAARPNSVSWDAAVAIQHAKQLCLLSRMMME